MRQPKCAATPCSVAWVMRSRIAARMTRAHGHTLRQASASFKDGSRSSTCPLPAINRCTRQAADTWPSSMARSTTTNGCADLGAIQGSISWRGHSDTEVLLAGFDAWGVQPTIEKCIGMFAFALWDRQSHTLTLGRDRLGEKPLYYGWQGDSFLFGSELKALKAHPAFCARVNRDAIALLMRLDYIPAPHSIYTTLPSCHPAVYSHIVTEARCQATAVLECAAGRGRRQGTAPSKVLQPKRCATWRRC